MEIERYTIYWVDLNPTKGSEINKIRPAVVVSPNELNRHLNTVIIIPLTSTLNHYPWRVKCSLDGKKGMIATDQIRTVDKRRIGKQAGVLNEDEIDSLTDALEEMLIS